MWATDVHLSIYFSVSLTTAPQPLPKPVLHTVRSTAPTSNPVLSLRSTSRCLRLLPSPPVTSIFPSITCFRRQILHNMWPIPLAFLNFTVCRMFLSPWLPVTLPHFSHDRPSWSSPFFSSTTFQELTCILKPIILITNALPPVSVNTADTRVGWNEEEKTAKEDTGSNVRPLFH